MSSTTQEFNCIFCKDTFENKEDLQIHFRKHGDPNFKQTQKYKSRPQNEAQTSTEKKNEVEMVSCDVCPEMFPTISKAITHKHKVHPDHDAKYFCPWCGKLFTMKHLYNKHLQSTHLNSERSDDINFHCDPCDVDFYVPSAMLYHNKFFHRQDTDLPTIGQSKKLRMCQQEVVPIYYCAFCGDEFDNKVNLHKHMSDDHGDENQSPEEVLKCPLCEAIFYHLDAFEVHLTFHSTEDLFREKNEMFEQLTEFSLETVPPIVEKVENVEPQEDVETAMNAVGIDKFLEMVMDETLDNDNIKTKPKKHKKHKKKKKEAITLDEFLSMNKDVFGEGIDFQGVEEVPTQVVAKRLKQNKIIKPVGNLKVAQSSEIEKLKKQGIVVKMKPTKKQNLKVGNKIVSKPIESNKPSTHAQATPDEVLSKLINQTNNQIKIVKKSAQDNQEPDQQERPTFPEKDNAEINKRGASPENIEVECDVNVPSEYTSSENETKEENVYKTQKAHGDNDQQSIDNRSTDTVNNTNLKNSDQSGELDNDMNAKDAENSNDNFDKHDNSDSEILHKDIDLGPVTALKNSPNITIKPMSKNVAQPSGKTSNGIEKTEEKRISVSENEQKECNVDTKENSSNNSLNSLKHLSHFITVKSVTPKGNTTPVPLQQTGIVQDELKISQMQDYSDHDGEEIPLKETQKQDTEESKEKPMLNSLKNLSKNITIKPVTNSLKNVTDKSSDDEESDNIPTRNKNFDNQTIPSTPSSSKLVTAVKDDSNLPSPKGQNIKANKPIVKDSSYLQEKQSNMNLLKHLTNVTAKPINTVKSNIQQKTNMHTKQNMPQNLLKKQENEEIEIFNIDDSDDEEEDKILPPINKIGSPKPNLTEKKSSKPLDTLKNISKNITVKPVNQQTSVVNKTNVQQRIPNHVSHDKNQGSFSDFSDDDDDQNTLIPTKLNTVQQKLRLQNDNLKTTLKNLGKYITVKSGVPSPNTSVKSEKDAIYSRDDIEMNNEADSDDSFSGKVKITEMTDDNDMSDGEMVERSNKNDSECNVTGKSPGESNSDHEYFNEADDDDDDLNDLEHQIKVNTLKKPAPHINKAVNFQNMNKNLTIKAISEKKEQGQKEAESSTKNIIPNMNRELSIKPFKPMKSENKSGGEAMTNKKTMNAAQVKQSIISQNQSMNQNVASTSQQNTVNKEVTVKTFQTKTVIQEITTTVTKTIKTVNQTVKQEVQSTSQNNVMKFQKVQGMKSSNQQIKNFQGVTVRHAAPVAGTKIRGGASPNVRPSNQLAPCNQLVPIRQRNTARMSIPRLAVAKQNTATSQPRPAVGRPLKISPNAVSAKRPTDEPMGHFSCFKKPKESLIPVSEIPSFANEQGGESVQFSSTQMTKSNFASATKTVRGNTVVTQMKSKVTSSSQHLEKLNSMSGLKVVKTSQSKQATKVEENVEMCPSKRNALQAIEKLQKQGLLVKKPRIEEVSNESDHSEDGDDYITEEPDD